MYPNNAWGEFYGAPKYPMSSAEIADSSVDPPSKKRKLEPKGTNDMANNGAASSSQVSKKNRKLWPFFGPTHAVNYISLTY